MVSLAGGIAQLQEDIGALVAEHKGRRGLQEFARYAEDPVGFVRDVLHFTFWSKQEEMALAVRDFPLTVVRSNNGMGKDAAAAALALWWIYARAGYVLITGPTERQVKSIVMGEVARHFYRAQDLPGRLYELALRLEGSEQRGLLAFTSGDASRLTGFHAPNLLCILTEAQGVESFVWEGLHANATGEGSRVLAVGNPLVSSGRFYEVSRSPHWHALQASAYDHPNVQRQSNLIPGAVTQEWIDRIVAEYGKSSPIYTARVMGEFPEESEQSLIRRQWLEAAVARYEARTLEAAASPEMHTAAVDPARYGSDRTALGVRQGGVLRYLVTWNGADTMETVGRIRSQLQEWQIPLRSHELSAYQQGPRFTRRVTVDEIGLGAGVLDRLREQGLPAEGFNGSQKPPWAEHQPRYVNRRASSYFHLRWLLENDRIALPRHEPLFTELLALNWRVNSEGKVLIESKDEIRARIGRSPDLADVVAECFEDFECRQGAEFRSVPIRWA